MTTYTNFLKQYLDYVQDNPFKGAPDELYDPANYILQLGGKRVRPLLVLLGYNLIANDVTKALPLANAVEVFHNFTLMHDDIMDNADVRRGEPTVHVKWNPNIAILSGDLMLVKAYQVLNNLNTDLVTKNQIIDGFGKMAEAVCVGQQFDMNFETQESVTESDYLSMIEGKTSVLLAYSLEAGGQLAGAEKMITDALYQYGLNIGLAFQVMDDYLDTFGDQASFGKRIGGDILENKKTLLWIEARKRANPNQLKTLNQWYEQTIDSQEKIDAVTLLFRTLEVDKYAEHIMNQFSVKASKYLDLIREHYNTEMIESLASDLMKRSK